MGVNVNVFTIITDVIVIIVALDVVVQTMIAITIIAVKWIINTWNCCIRCDGSILKIFQRSTLNMFQRSILKMFQRSILKMFQRSTFKMFQRSTFKMFQRSTLVFQPMNVINAIIAVQWIINNNLIGLRLRLRMCHSYGPPPPR